MSVRFPSAQEAWVRTRRDGEWTEWRREARQSRRVSDYNAVNNPLWVAPYDNWEEARYIGLLVSQYTTECSLSDLMNVTLSISNNNVIFHMPKL